MEDCFTHIFREANIVAGKLGNLDTTVTGFSWWPDPPPELLLYLIEML